MSGRPDWNRWFLDGADWASQRADCSRRKVGAVIVKDRRIISTGYNGALPGERGCLSGGCPRATSDVPPGSQYEHGPGACIAIHAELNAVLSAAKNGIALEGSEMYVNCEPCDTCTRLVFQSGVGKLYYRSSSGEVFQYHSATSRGWRVPDSNVHRAS